MDIVQQRQEPEELAANRGQQKGVTSEGRVAQISQKARSADRLQPKAESARPRYCVKKRRSALKARENSRLHPMRAGNASKAVLKSFQFCRAFSAGRFLKFKPRARKLILG
jgi:hypothetical protein